MQKTRPDPVKIVALEKIHAACIRHALVKAIFNPGGKPLPDAILRDRSLAKYHQSWGGEGDFGFAAVLGDDDAVVGVCWCRLLRGADRGFGYVDDDMPELSIAVWEGFRDKGIGTKLIEMTISEARSRGYRGLSLSVQRENRSVALYERQGFEIFRREGAALTMCLDLR